MKKKFGLCLVSFLLTFGMIYLSIPHFIQKEKFDELSAQLKNWKFDE